MTSPHEQTSTHEQLPLGERYANAANEHALQILKGVKPEEIAFTPLAIMSRERKFSDTNAADALRDQTYYFLTEYADERFTSKSEDSLDLLQRAVVEGDQIPEKANPQLAALLILGAELFNRTERDAGQLTGNTVRYYDEKITNLENMNQRGREKLIAETVGNTTTAQAVAQQPDTTQVGPGQRDLKMLPPESGGDGIHI